MISKNRRLNDKMPETAVLVVNWNGKRLLKGCFDSLKRQTYKDFMAIMVDNNSSDDSVEFVNKDYAWVKVIRLTKNTGVAGGNNAGFEEAKKYKSIKYVAMLNNDAIVDKEWLGNLVDVMKKDKKISGCCAKAVYLKNRRIIDTNGILIYGDGSAQGKDAFKEASKIKDIEEVFGATGVAGLYRRDALEKAGFFDDIFFMYLEEVDLAWRLRYAGYKAFFVPSAIAYHAHSASSESFSPFKAYYTERNRIWLVFKNFTSLMMIKSVYYTLKRYIALARGASKKEGAAGEFVKKNSVILMPWILIKAYFVGLIALPLFIPKRFMIMRMRMKNGIGRKQIGEWFARFSTDSERIALIKK